MNPKKLPIGKIEMPKVHGQIKVGIPSKEEVDKMDMAGAYSHFNQRLNERYGIDVTFDEYIELSKKYIKTLRKQKHKRIGIMEIKGIPVVVVKEIDRRRKLVTALPFKNQYNEQ